MNTPGSSLFIIARDPARSIRRGRQLFQRKFTRAQGQGPRTDLSVGAGLVDSCAGCHGRPRGSAGFGGDVVTRPDSRDAPHLFGLGLQEMLADEITADLRAIRAQAKASAASRHRNVTRNLTSKGISYGRIAARPNGTVDTSDVEGVNAGLRVRPFFAQGGTISIREFVVGAFNAEMGLEGFDPDLAAALQPGGVVTPSGMRLDGSTDTIEQSPVPSTLVDGDMDGVANEIPVSLLDHMEFYLLNYFKAGTGQETYESEHGRRVFREIGCAKCHVPTSGSSGTAASPMSRRCSIPTTGSSTASSRRRRSASSFNCLMGRATQRRSSRASSPSSSATSSNFPQEGHGSIKLGALFNDPADPE